MFLIGKTRPNYDFLSLRKSINNSSELLDYIKMEGRKIDFSQLVEDLRPFIFNPGDADRVLSFLEYIEDILSWS